MFIQVIRGTVSDREGLKDQFERWAAELAVRPEPVPDAGVLEVPEVGWLGTTAGISEEGEFVALVRFESEELARQNERRPEQMQWWAETERFFASPPTFRDCKEVDLLLGGGSDVARFVQVVEGRSDTIDRLRSLTPKLEEALQKHRSEVIGATLAYEDGGALTAAIYFTSEEAARAGEASDIPELARIGNWQPEYAEAVTAQQREVGDETIAEQEGWLSLLQQVNFIDLRDPWLWSPREVPY